MRILKLSTDNPELVELVTLLESSLPPHAKPALHALIAILRVTEQEVETAKRNVPEAAAKIRRIATWFGEFPRVNDRQGGTMSYGAAYGSNGERDYMRAIAVEALKLLEMRDAL